MEPRNNHRNIITIPNLLSAFRICLIPGIVWLFCVEENPSLAGDILILSGVTDVVDGFIARKFHMVSDLGKVLDPLADKLTQGAVLLCLLLQYPLMLLPLLFLVGKEAFMTVTGYLVIRKTGIVFGADWHGKAATCMLYAMMMLHLFLPELSTALSHASIALCCAMIGVSFVLYARRNLKALRRNPGSCHS